MSPEQARLVRVTQGELPITSVYAGQHQVDALFASDPKLPSKPYLSPEELVADFEPVLDVWHHQRPALKALKCKDTAATIYYGERLELDEVARSLDVTNPDQALAYAEEVADVIIAAMIMLKHVGDEPQATKSYLDEIHTLAITIQDYTGLPIYPLLSYKMLVNHCNYPPELFQSPAFEESLATIKALRSQLGGNLLVDRRSLIDPWFFVYGSGHD